MRKFLKGLLWTAGILGAIAIVLRATIFDVWTIPLGDPIWSLSLAPNLAPGDVVVLMRRGRPSFGDVVRCQEPVGGRWVVARLIGESGDKVAVDATSLVVNGRGATSNSACKVPRWEVTEPNSGNRLELRCSVEEMGGGWYEVLYFPGGKDARTFKKTADVPVGHAYLVSDNRYHHFDSRDYGTVQRDTCGARVVFRLWSAAGWSDGEHRMTYVR